MSNSLKTILLIPRIKVLNANALSSPYTIGVPAMTAFLGAVHALERKVRAHSEQGVSFTSLRFKSTAVIFHEFDLQTYKGRGDYVHSIIGTANPLDKNGQRPSFIEEARAHFTLSLMIEVEGLDLDFRDEFLEELNTLLHSGLKMASGDILEFGELWLKKFDELSETDRTFKKLLALLMPGFCLIERRDLMEAAMNGGADALDALLDHLKVTWRCEQKDNGPPNWSGSRKANGWIVPIATGFQAISPLGNVKNQRDPDTPHRFAEAVVTLGEFVMPYRFEKLDHMLWHTRFEEQSGLYLCQQNEPVPQTISQDQKEK